ncbi:hypothetical protein VUR80DRAFT_1359 [Thermomyces stellatus]
MSLSPSQLTFVLVGTPTKKQTSLRRLVCSRGQEGVAASHTIKERSHGFSRIHCVDIDASPNRRAFSRLSHSIGLCCRDKAEAAGTRWRSGDNNPRPQSTELHRGTNSPIAPTRQSRNEIAVQLATAALKEGCESL